MLIEMTRLSTDTLGISISLQIKLHLPPAAELDDMYDSCMGAECANLVPLTSYSSTQPSLNAVQDLNPSDSYLFICRAESRVIAL